jgi:hypothetical protein
VSYEVTRGRKGLQAANVSRGSAKPDISGAHEGLRVPLEVEAAGRVLAEHFDPDELYWAMVDAHRQR